NALRIVRLQFNRHQLWVLRNARDITFFGPLLIPSSLFVWVLWPIVPMLIFIGSGPIILPPIINWLGISWFVLVGVFMFWYFHWFIISITLLFGDVEFANRKEARLLQRITDLDR
ncbi:hypothetical protein, partial [Roseibium sp.]|uniref:hypothetical protein n=1 Tax=Roseibium sp. TaxID=1936156 RepID=UPI003D0F6FF3